MFSVFKNVKSDKEYKSMTGLSKAAFECLYLVFCDLYEAKESNPYGGVRQPVLMDKREALFFILHYYKAYPTLVNMGIYFGFSEYTVSQYLARIKPYLKASLAQNKGIQTTLFKDQAAFDAAFEGVDDLYIDVTEVATERPQNIENQKERYSGKKNYILKNG